MTTVGEATQLNNAVYSASVVGGSPVQGAIPGGGLPGGWALAQVVDHDATGGVFAAVYVNSASNQVFVAIRGTASTADLITDLGVIAQVLPTSQISDASSILSSVISNPSYSADNVALGGQSLGGEIVNYVGANPTFSNIPVLAEDAPNQLSSSIATTPNVLNITAQGDWVGNFGAPYANTVTVDIGAAPGMLFGIPTQLGGQGTHNPLLMANVINAQDSTLAGTNLTPTYAATISTSAIDAPNVSSITIGSQIGNNVSADLSQNSDGVYAATTTTTDSSGTITETTTSENSGSSTHTVDTVVVNTTTGSATESILIRAPCRLGAARFLILAGRIRLVMISWEHLVPCWRRYPA
jgi:hypothetical protein